MMNEIIYCEKKLKQTTIRITNCTPVQFKMKLAFIDRTLHEALTFTIRLFKWIGNFWNKLKKEAIKCLISTLFFRQSLLSLSPGQSRLFTIPFAEHSNHLLPTNDRQTTTYAHRSYDIREIKYKIRKLQRARKGDTESKRETKIQNIEGANNQIKRKKRSLIIACCWAAVPK